MYTLKVDHREGKLKEFFDEHKVACVYENLTFGDFQILNPEHQIKLVFERKSTDDMLASIKDGRYKNQKAHIFSAGFQATQVFYILEGSFSFTSAFGARNTQNLILQSSIINTMIRDNIGCFVTSSLRETFDLIVGIFNRISKDPSKYFDGKEIIQEHTIVLSSSTDTPYKIWKNMLCQIPGISEKTVVALTDKWNCFQSFYAELSSCDEARRLQILNECKVGGRKLGKRVVEGLLKHFF